MFQGSGAAVCVFQGVWSLVSNVFEVLSRCVICLFSLFSWAVLYCIPSLVSQHLSIAFLQSFFADFRGICFFFRGIRGVSHLFPQNPRNPSSRFATVTEKKPAAQ